MTKGENLEFITQKELKELLHYDPETGVFTWLKSRGSCDSGVVAGTKVNGYVKIRIHRRRYYAHRLAWLYVHGEFPPLWIDHVNRVRSDNRISNLRLSGPMENAQNRPILATNKSGIAGVNWHKVTGKWTAQISVGKKKIYLGVYDSLDDAEAARVAAKKHYHAFHPLDDKK